MLVETKCDIGQKIYFVFGNPKKNIIVYSAIINKISIFTNNHIMYTFCDAKLELDKDNIAKNLINMQFGFFYENDVDNIKRFLIPTEKSSYPVFTSKKKCIEYLRRVIK